MRKRNIRPCGAEQCKDMWADFKFFRVVYRFYKSMVPIFFTHETLCNKDESKPIKCKPFT